jgi:hypothetical protein
MKNAVTSVVSKVTAEQATTPAADPQTRWYAEHNKSHPDEFVIVVSVDKDGSIRTRSNCTMETIARVLAAAAEQFILVVERKADPEAAKKMN